MQNIEGWPKRFCHQDCGSASSRCSRRWIRGAGRSHEAAEKQREAAQAARAAEDFAERREPILASLGALPEDERLYARVCLGLRRALGAESYFWTELISPAVFRGIQGNHICLGVKPKIWHAALVLQDCLHEYLPEAQEHSDLSMSIVFEKLAAIENAA